jgi:hypothetical protein
MKLKSILNSRLTVFLLSIFLPTTPATAAQGPFVLLHSLFDPGTNTQSGEQQGYSVAIDGNIAVVGVPGDDVGNISSGVAKVYDTTAGVLLYTLTNSSPAPGGNFGISVAIAGTRIVVGAGYADTGTRYAGTAYLYDLASPTPNLPVATLTNPSPVALDHFGSSVAISGARVVIGAPNNSAGAQYAGSAYVYDLAGATPTVPTLTLTNPGPASFEYFGNSVAVAGTRVVIGAYRDHTGADEAGSAYVYDLASTTPIVPVFTLTNPSPARGFFFGHSVAMSGTRIVIAAPYDNFGTDGAGSAYVYDLAGTTPTVPLLTITNPGPAAVYFFGSPVAISDGWVFVGIPYSSGGAIESGGAYVYDLSSATPNIPALTLTDPIPADSDQFGFSVAISHNRVVVGARGADSAYVFDLAGSTPTNPVATLNHRSPASRESFGNSVAVSGTRVVVGAPYDGTWAFNAGSAYIYDLSSALAMPMLTLTNPSPASSDYFGSSVAISGTRVVVGAYGDDTGANDAGSAYVYELAGAIPAVPVLMLTNPSPALSDSFGNSVAVSGSWAVIGAYGDSTRGFQAGSAYVYNLAGVMLTAPLLTLTNPSPATRDYFGFSVAICGTRAVVGAYSDDTGAADAGSAYVYDLACATPTAPLLTLTNPEPAAYDYFGYSVAISGTRVVVGAYNAGSVYVYDLASATPTVPEFTLTNPNSAANHFFGISVAISGAQIVVGAERDDTWLPLGGSAYMYDLASATPTMPVAKLTKPSPAMEDIFAHAVAIDGTTVVVGTPGDDTNAADRGAAYIFGPVPWLNIVPVAPGLASISWTPATSSGFVLQCADSLAPTNWLNVPSGAANPVTVSSTNATRFYRLFHP